MIQYMLDRSFLVNVIMMAICLLGGFTLYNMKRDLIPPLSWPYIHIEARLPGASASEMERLVTFPLEESVRGIGEIKNITSTTQAGYTEIWLEFDGHDLGNLESLQSEVKDHLSHSYQQLPSDLEPLQVTADRVRDVYLSSYSIKNFDSLNVEHRASLLKTQSQINQVPGVARTEINIDDRNLFVRILPERLKEYEISVLQIRKNLAEYLSFQPLGQIRWNGQKFSVEIQSPVIDAQVFKSIPIQSNRTGQKLVLGDLAKIEWDSWEKQRRWLWNGQSVAEIEVRKNITSDSIQLHQKVTKKIAELQSQLPQPLILDQSFDGPRFIRKQIEVLSINGWMGFLLVIFILSIFLGVRSALMAAWGLPVAYLGTFIVLSWFGISIDLLSILGLILVVGIIVDDAIIVTDKYNELLSQGLQPKEAALVSAKELIVPVTGTIITTIVAFVPLMTIQSNLTWFLKAVPMIVIISLSVSWAESFFILPNHLAHFCKRPERPIGQSLMEKLQDLFEHSVRFILSYKWRFLMILVSAGLGIGYLTTNKLQQYFNVSIGSEQIVIYIALKESNSLDITQDKIKPILNYISTLEKTKIEYSSTQLGFYKKDGQEEEGFRFATITLGINGYLSHPVEIRKQMQPEIEGELAKLKTNDFELLTAEERKRGEEDYNKNTLAVQINGQNAERFSAIQNVLKDEISKINGLEIKNVNSNTEIENWYLKPDYEQMAKYNISKVQLSSQIREHISAFKIGEVRTNGESISLLTEVLYPKKLGYAELSEIQIINNIGETIPVKWLGQWAKNHTPQKINHEKGARYSEVRFKFDDKIFNIETAKDVVARRLSQIAEKFPGFVLTLENANKRDEENKQWIAKVTVYSLGGVALVLIILLGSFIQPFFVLVPVPIGIMGAMLMLYLHKMPLTLMAVIGLLGVIGVAVNDSIVLTHHLNRLRSVTTHIPYFELVVQAARSRLRAILLTSLTTLGGLFPTAYGLFGESGFTQPIAFTMAWGLFFSTMATLYVLPVLLLLPERFYRNKTVNQDFFTNKERTKDFRSPSI